MEAIVKERVELIRRQVQRPSFWLLLPSSPLKMGDSWAHLCSEGKEPIWGEELEKLKCGEKVWVINWGTKSYLRISHGDKDQRERRYCPRTLIPSYFIHHHYFDFGYGLLNEDYHFISIESDVRKLSSKWATA